MEEHGLAPFIVMADDDEDDWLLARAAFKAAGLGGKLYIVGDGMRLMDYLCRRGKFSDPVRCPRPDLIVLDLNMPRKNGREALREIKSDPDLAEIPVVILTTSNEDRDIAGCTENGAFSFVTKPALFKEWVEIAKLLLEIVSRKRRPDRNAP